MSDEILTVDEAALVLKVGPDVISGLLESGDLPGKQVGGSWRTTSRALVNHVDGLGDGMMCCPPGTCCVPVEQSAASGGGCGC